MASSEIQTVFSLKLHRSKYESKAHASYARMFTFRSIKFTNYGHFTEAKFNGRRNCILSFKKVLNV